MLKTGICKIHGIERQRTVWGRPRRLSLGLLNAIEPADSGADEYFFQILRSLRQANGTYRTTARERFRDFDPVVNEILASVIHADDVTIHDWATSDGSAGLQWARTVRQIFQGTRFYASDRVLTVVRVFNARGESFYFEPTGEPLQYMRPPFVISLQEPESAAYPVNRWIARRAFRNVPVLAERVRTLSWPSLLDTSPQTHNGWTFSQISLLHPAVRAFAERNGWFKVGIHSVFEPLRASAHVIRSLNILNRAYFSLDDLARGMQVAYRSIYPGGVWIVGRSEDDTGLRMNATLFQKTDYGFSTLATIGSGCEIAQLVREARFTHAAVV